MRRDAADARKYGCTGLMGIHWRTRILGPNVSALAKAAWDQTRLDGGSEAGRRQEVAITCRWRISMPIGPARNLAPEAAEPIAAIFARLDGRMPRPADWVTGPGSIRPDPRPWEQVQKEYAFVDELAAVRPQVAGPGNLERFDYWLNTFRYLRSIAEVRCVWAQFNAAMDKAKAEKDPDTRKKLAAGIGLAGPEGTGRRPFAELHRHLLATVTTSGEMGSVCNWQQQTLPVLLIAPGQELAEMLGEQLPADAVPSKQYAGPPRLFVPEVRSGIAAGETLKLTVIILGAKPQAAVLYWRRLGQRRIRQASAATRGPRRVYRRASGRGRQGRLRVLRVGGGRPEGGPISGRRRRAATDGGGVRNDGRMVREKHARGGLTTTLGNRARASTPPGEPQSHVAQPPPAVSAAISHTAEGGCATFLELAP